MEISFSTKKQEDAANDFQKLQKYLSKKKASCDAEEVVMVLNALQAAPNLHSLPPIPFHPHPLKGEFKGSFAVWINKTDRIVFTPDHDGDESFRIDNYKTITRITIQELCIDYHN